jgi:hypothetical protein
MHEDIRNLLNAYLDGELHGTRLLEVKLHLASCEICREELKGLRLVSDLLHDAPAPEFMPAERFVSNLTLSLPRRALRDRPPKPGSLAWWLVPAGLMAAWFFMKTVFMLTGVVTAADTAGLLRNAPWLNGEQQWIWIGLVQNIFGLQTAAQPGLATLNEVSVFGINLFNGFLWQAVIVLFYWGWLATWWMRRGPRPMKAAATR